MSPPLFIFAIDHRPVMAHACEEAGASLDRISEFKLLAVDAVSAARDERPAMASQMSMLLDDRYGSAALALARARGIRAGQPVERGAVCPLEFERPDWETAIVGARPAFVKVRIDGRPDGDKGQERRLLEISEACERADVPLMPEPLLRPRFDVEERPELTARWMQSLRDLGVRARWWKIEGLDTEDAARRVADACAPGEGLLVLGQSAPTSKLALWFKAARVDPRYEGFAVGRSIFWEPFGRYLKGESPGVLSKELKRRYLEIVDLWR